MWMDNRTDAEYCDYVDARRRIGGREGNDKDIEWLAGARLGEGLGGVSEEVWSSPQYGAMMGSYRPIVDKKNCFL